MQALSIIQQLIIWVPPVLLAVTLHEVAHGLVALRLGDTTARDLGRLSLNPLRHIDPVGTILVPAVLLWLGGFVFGWAKPVPVDFRRLRNPKRDMALVAAAGPASNLVMALAWTLMLSALVLGRNLPFIQFLAPLYLMSTAGITINILLAVLNMLPIPPLDGGRVAVGMLPPRLALLLARVEPFGLFILIALLASGILSKILGPPIAFLEHAFLSLTPL
jgi:Zn-dependent protease